MQKEAAWLGRRGDRPQFTQHSLSSALDWALSWMLGLCRVTKLAWRPEDFTVQFSSVAQLCLTLRPHGLQHARPPCPSPTLLPPSIFPSIRVFPNESALQIRWPKYWSFSFNISPSNEHPGLISFRMDWLDLLAVQGTPKSLLQHRSSKASILWCSAVFIDQLSHLSMTTGKTIALTIWTFVGNVMSLLFNMLSSLVITFLPRSKRFLISWLQSPSAVILEPPKNEVCHCFYYFPIYLHEVTQPDSMILVF